MPTELFEEKYRPGIDGILGQEKELREIKAQIKLTKQCVEKIKAEYKKAETEQDEEVLEKIKARISKLKRFKIRHQIFYGGPGCGKTTTAIAMAKEIYGEEWRDFFFEFNGSNDRTITFIRQKVKDLTSSGTKYYPFCIIFLDEADGILSIAQEALRRIIETSRSAVFIFGCNKYNKIIDPIRSRCTPRRFKAPKVNDAVKRMEFICKKEGIEVEEGFLKELYLSKQGDMRNCIGKLGEMSDMKVKLTLEMIEKDEVPPESYRTFYNLAKSGKMKTAYRQYIEVKIDNGITPGEFVDELCKYALNLDIPEDFKAELFTFTYTHEVDENSDKQILAIIGKVYQLHRGYKNKSQG